MRTGWLRRLPAAIAALGAAAAAMVSAAGPAQNAWTGVLNEHPAIDYASRPTTDPVVRLSRRVPDAVRSFQRDTRTGYLASVLEAFDISTDSQLLVFSKTGVQRAFTGPRTPRALYFNESVAVGYVPDAPALEIAAQDPQQGTVFYTVDQTSPTPAFVRQTGCLVCHISSSTLDVPGLIARSNTVGRDGNVLAHTTASDVDQRTPHPDRWGGWFVTLEGAPPPYSQRGHLGNITFDERGNTSSQVFIDWINSSPETRGYPSSSSDIVSLLLFEHQARAVNLMTRLDWESRIAAGEQRNLLSADSIRRLVADLGDYLLFVGEASLPVPLTARQGVAERLRRSTPRDRLGRSFGELSLAERLLRYPCSYMVYSETFDALPAEVRRAVYRRMADRLAADATSDRAWRVSAADRRAVVEILSDTKADFPRAVTSNP